jgi:hypothetical protein
MIPLRIVTEGLGAQVDWVGETNTVLINHAGTSMSLVVGEDLGLDANGDSLGAAVNISGTVFVPARYVIEALGANVSWDPVAQAVYILN